MKPLSPLVQMTLAIVALCGMLVLLGQLLFDAVPDPARQRAEMRKVIGETLAVQVAELLQRTDAPTVQRTLTAIAARSPDVRSMGIRRADGELLVQTGNHQALGLPRTDDRSDPDRVLVPLHVGNERWGQVEIAFVPAKGHPLLRWFTDPMVMLMLFIGAGGTVVFGLYMRRALQHLDPSSVVPERVQGAFDAMAEGVVVLDARGRVMLANRAFRGLHPSAAGVRPGMGLSSMSWLAASLPDDSSSHPWNRAMSERAPNAGTALKAAAEGTAEVRHLVVSAAPIADPGGSVRGCLATFSDVSALHHANEALREAMGRLEASKREIEEKAVELERLATRDPLTGCLNRRSFMQAFERLFASAQAEGTPLSCVMVDIDHFKSVNDSYGHAVGDRVIQELARRLHESARATDLVCRYGGEEFCVVLPGLGAREAYDFGERLRARVESACGPAVREVPNMRVTSSVGVDNLSTGATSAAALLDRADQALYAAKRGGRNRVRRYQGAETAQADDAGVKSDAKADANSDAKAGLRPADTKADARTQPKAGALGVAEVETSRP